MEPRHLSSFANALSEGTTKVALMERLVRLGLTDVPKTPRLLMRHRSPQELAVVQHGIANAFQKVEAPLMQKAERGISKVVNAEKFPKLHKGLVGGANLAIQNPEILPMQAIPIPGLTPAYMGGKKLLEKGIDKLAPLP